MQEIRIKLHNARKRKHREHYRLSLEVGISNFNNFWYDYFWHNWPSEGARKPQDTYR